jgi:hypothetical protein
VRNLWQTLLTDLEGAQAVLPACCGKGLQIGG